MSSSVNHSLSVSLSLPCSNKASFIRAKHPKYSVSKSDHLFYILASSTYARRRIPAFYRMSLGCTNCTAQFIFANANDCYAMMSSTHDGSYGDSFSLSHFRLKKEIGSHQNPSDKGGGFYLSIWACLEITQVRCYYLCAQLFVVVLQIS